MHCPNCGVQIASDSRLCTDCDDSASEATPGAGIFQYESSRPAGEQLEIPNNLKQVFLVTVSRSAIFVVLLFLSYLTFFSLLGPVLRFIVG